jgi:putative oxidoreductase
LKSNKELPLSLLLLRLGVFIVMFMWTLDKFVNLGHTAAVMKKNFIFGYKKKWTYGIVLVLHASFTLSFLGNIWAPEEICCFLPHSLCSPLASLFICCMMKIRCWHWINLCRFVPVEAIKRKANRWEDNEISHNWSLILHEYFNISGNFTHFGYLHRG